MRQWNRRLFTLAALFSGTALQCPGAAAQTYMDRVLLDATTPRPDGMGNFSVDWPTPAAFDGTSIVFVDFGATTQEIWRDTPATNVMTKLVDTTVHAPGGSGNFSGFVPPNNNLGGLGPRISGGKLYFWAEDQNGSNGYGLYWISLSGGAVHLVVNYATAKPEGGTFDFISSFVVSGTAVLFNTGSGVFVGSSAGTAPVVVADASTQIHIPGSTSLFGCYAGKAIDGANVVVSASDCNDPSRGYNVLFVGPYANFASLDKLPVVTSAQTLPNDPTAAPHLDVISNSAFLFGNLMYFGSADTFATISGGLYGQYFAPFGAGGAPTTPSGSPIYRVFDNISSGLTGPFGQFGAPSFSDGALAFLASNTQTSAQGLYLASGAVPTLVYAPTQSVVAPVGLAGGKIAFNGSGFFDAQVDEVTASSCGVAIASTITIARGPITAGATAGTYLQNVRLSNPGTASIAGPIALALSALTPGVALVNETGVTQCATPSGVPIITAVSAGSRLAAGGSVIVGLQFYSPATSTINYKPVAVRGNGTP